MADGDPRSDNAAQEAVDFLRTVAEADSTNRQQGLEDLRFRYVVGAQWPGANILSRQLEDRPALTINETDAYCRQITNGMRLQRPRIRVHPVDAFADKKTAKVIAGLCRHVEVNSNADIAYDHAADMQVTMGVGYWRLRTDYIRDDSMDQDIFIDPIYNSFSVYNDPNSVMLDGSDAEKTLITDEMPKKAFQQQFKGAAIAPFSDSGSGDGTNEWQSVNNIRLAEFFRIDRVPAKLVRLSDGRQNMDVYEDEIPPAAMRAKLGIEIVGDRASFKRRVLWQKQTAFEVLEKRVLPGRWIPVVPCYGARVWVDGKMMRFGAVRFARDPQVMVNFWNTSITECVAQAPKAKWQMAAGQDDGFENEYAQANVKATAVLHYNMMDVEGKPVPPPQRIQPEGPPQGMLACLMGANANLRSVMGITASDVPRPGIFPKSQELAQREQGQTEQSNYHFYDNLTVSICHTGRIILDWAPKIWDTQRMQRIIGDDGKPSLVVLNEKAIDTVKNDVTVGTYDVVMETGPGYNTKQEEGLAAFLQLMATPLGEPVAQTSGDLVVRMMDAPGAEAVADRMAAANPLAQVDEQSDVPPQAQMMIKSLQMKVEEAGKIIQNLELEKKYRRDTEDIKQKGETQRVLMKETGATERAVMEGQAALAEENAENEAWMRDVAVQAQAQLSVAEINAMVKLLTTNTQVEASDRSAERQIAAKAEEARAKTTAP